MRLLWSWIRASSRSCGISCYGKIFASMDRGREVTWSGGRGDAARSWCGILSDGVWVMRAWSEDAPRGRCWCRNADSFKILKLWPSCTMTLPNNALYLQPTPLLPRPRPCPCVSRLEPRVVQQPVINQPSVQEIRVVKSSHAAQEPRVVFISFLSDRQPHPYCFLGPVDHR